MKRLRYLEEKKIGKYILIGNWEYVLIVISIFKELFGRSPIISEIGKYSGMNLSYTHNLVVEMAKFKVVNKQKKGRTAVISLNGNSNDIVNMLSKTFPIYISNIGKNVVQLKRFYDGK